ncbi:MAG: hypothetical protein JSV62_05095 [Promethearchaeota archaeon]|nr:MAG: hypothetical protein JSV62_05095 [Candidatus Lokiarchaeota archaeon]
MAIGWEVGKEARELDEKSIKERAKIEGRSIKRVGYALIFYSLIMTIFFFCL